MLREAEARSRRACLGLLSIVAVFSTSTQASEGGGKTAWDLRGRVASQALVTAYPEDSLLREVVGARAEDLNLAARFMFGLEQAHWRVNVAYQLLASYGDSLELAREVPNDLQSLVFRRANDDRRLFDLTWSIADSDSAAFVHRFDRLSVGRVTRKTVWRFGRQAITWGNGLIYTPMDIFNPFDPAAVDKEFKIGDDMLYTQYLRSNGDDVQSVLVVRRDLRTGDVEADASSLAFKYHGLIGRGELDLLASRHYGNIFLGAGGNIGVGGALWRGDLVLDFAERGPVLSGVTSLSRSWVRGGKNLSGVLELYYNGFGQSDECYSPQCLEENPELLARIARGEIFVLGRDYVAASVNIEVTPLMQLTPTLFTNLGDPSALLQVATYNDLREDLVLWGAVFVPIGSDGTEFGGPPTGIDGLYLSRDLGLFVQLGWYW